MIDSCAPWYDQAMRTSVFLLFTFTAAASLGCDDPNGTPQDTGESGESGANESGTESGETETGDPETGNETDDLETCNEPLPAAAIDHEIEFSGFPEIDGEMILDGSGFEYSGNCTVVSLGSVPPLNAIVLDCEHPSSDTAEVTLTLDGVDFPAGLEVSEVVELHVSSAVNVGGLVDELDIDNAGPKPWMLLAGYQSYEVRDVDGLVFAAMHGLSDFSADYGELTLALADACPSYEFGDTDIEAYFHAETSEASIDVAVGETKSVALGELAYDVQTFRAQRSCCHGDLADVRVIRTAP